MLEIHQILKNQLERLGLQLGELPKNDKQWISLITLISNTYKENEEHHYSMERSLDISTEEMNDLIIKNDKERSKINNVTTEGLIFTDCNWFVRSVNHKALNLLKYDNRQLINKRVDDEIHIINNNSHKIELDKLFDHFECGNSYLCPQGFFVSKGHKFTRFPCSFTINPIFQNGVLSEFIIIFRDQADIIKDDLLVKLDKAIDSVEDGHSNMLKKHESMELTSNTHNCLLSLELSHLHPDDSMSLMKDFSLLYFQNNSSKILGSYSSNKKTYLSDTNPMIFDSEKELDKFKVMLSDLFPKIQFNIKESSSKGVVLVGSFIVFKKVILKIIYNILNEFLSVKTIDFSTDYFESFNDFVTLSFTVSVDLLFELSVNDKRVLYNLIRKKSDLYSIKFSNKQFDGRNIRFTISDNFIESKKQSWFEPTYFFKKYKILSLFETPDNALRKYLFGFFHDRENIDEVYSIGDAVNLFKQNRLNQDAYDLIITDDFYFSLVGESLSGELISYVSESFCGLVVISKAGQEIDLTNIPNKLFVCNENDLHNDLLDVFVEIKKSESDAFLLNPESRLKSYNKNVLFYDFDIVSTFLLHKTFCLFGLKIFTENIGLITEEFLKEHCIECVFINVSSNYLEASMLTNLLRDMSDRPILVSCPYLNEEDRLMMIQSGVDDFIFQPYSISSVESILNKHLSMDDDPL